jgi:hypothetical protein
MRQEPQPWIVRFQIPLHSAASIQSWHFGRGSHRASGNPLASCSHGAIRLKTNQHDLVVAEGGPAGAAAAITAARLRAHFLLLEHGRFPRHKVCGEFVSGEAFKLLERLLRPEEEMLLICAQKTTAARLFIGSSVARFPISPAASISRYDLDAELWRAAERAGVDCRQRLITLNGKPTCFTLGRRQEFSLYAALSTRPENGRN